MPLLLSPIDGSPMRQIHRYGIEIDVCPTSGGIWLDKGELEKILHLIQEDAAQQQSAMNSPHSQPHSAKHHASESHSHARYHEKGYYGSGKYHKKESKMSKIMDLFDF